MSGIKGLLAIAAVLIMTVIGIALVARQPPVEPPRRNVIVPVPVLPRDRPREPRCPRCPRTLEMTTPLSLPLNAAAGGRISPDGVQLSVDYPGLRHLTNDVGNDGLGLCVYASNAMAMDWHNQRGGRELLNFMTRRPGGGTPRKFDADMKAFWASKGKPVPKYVQYEGSDINVLIRAVSGGRMVCGTYYRSPSGRYGGRKTYHMVDWVHADGERFAVLDNNYPGDTSYEWMNRQEAERSVKDEDGKMWLVIFVSPPPPPPPHNAEEVSR